MIVVINCSKKWSKSRCMIRWIIHAYWLVLTYDVTINNISLFCHIKQIDSMLPWIFTVIDHRRGQNQHQWHTQPRLVCHFFVLANFDVICDLLLNKGGKFLKKLWCCVGGSNKVIWFYQQSWNCKLASVSPSSEFWRRANARNVSFFNSLRWPIYNFNLVDKTKLSYYWTDAWQHGISLSISWHRCVYVHQEHKIMTSKKKPEHLKLSTRNASACCHTDIQAVGFMSICTYFVTRTLYQKSWKTMLKSSLGRRMLHSNGLIWKITRFKSQILSR